MEQVTWCQKKSNMKRGKSDSEAVIITDMRAIKLLKVA